MLLSLLPGLAGGQISGVVKTENGQPVSAATVQVWGTAQLLVESGTDGGGQFHFEINPQEVRRIRIAHLGFGTVIIPGNQLSSSPLTVILEPLPVPLPELEVVVTRSMCDEKEDPAARAVWSAARSRYSPETGYRGGAVRFLTSSGLVDPASVGQVPARTRLEPGFHEWVGATATTTPGRYLLLETRIKEQGYVRPGDRFSIRRSENWGYPEFEGRDAYHFISETFGERHTFHLGISGGGGIEVAFCPADRDPPTIQGRLFFSADTTLLKANWMFRTKKPVEEAGGEVVFAQASDSTGSKHLVSAQGIFRRKELRGPRYEGVPQPYFQIFRLSEAWAISSDDRMPDSFKRD